MGKGFPGMVEFEFLVLMKKVIVVVFGQPLLMCINPWVQLANLARLMMLICLRMVDG